MCIVAIIKLNYINGASPTHECVSGWQDGVSTSVQSEFFKHSAKK